VKRILLTALIATAALPATANAATQVGETVDPSTSACSQNVTWLQSTSPSNRFVVPSDGVITSWSFQGGSIVPSQLKLKLGRVGATSMSIVAQSAFETPAVNTLNTFASQVPAHTGDILGFYFPSPNFARCAATSQVGYVNTFTGGDVVPGGTGSPIVAEDGTHLDLAATLEPDCDKDGLGDETQDKDITSCSCAGSQVTQASTQGPDNLVGTAGRDVINALGGNDKVSGLGGNDLICGGAGKDTLKGGPGNDKLLGQAGKDTLKGGPGKDKLKGGPGKDKQIQ
jgi:hypothetical protein